MFMTDSKIGNPASIGATGESDFCELLSFGPEWIGLEPLFLTRRNREQEEGVAESYL